MGSAIFLQAYLTVCDLLIVFSRQLGSNSSLSSLIFEPDKTLQHLLNNFIQAYVFIDDDEDGKYDHYCFSSIYIILLICIKIIKKLRIK